MEAAEEAIWYMARSGRERPQGNTVGGQVGRVAREGGVVRDFRKNAGAELGTRE